MKEANNDADIKKNLLKNQMTQLIEQMRRLKTNSDEIEERLYQLLQETLAMLQRNFE